MQGLIRVDGKAELMRFVARNIRAISPLRWDLNSGQGVLTQFDTGTVGSRPQIVNDSGTAPADMSQLPPEELRKLHRKFQQSRLEFLSLHLLRHQQILQM